MTAALPVVRRPDFALDETVPRWWMWDDRVLTRNSDALHMLFPSGERFFVRSVAHYRKRIEDPALKARIKAFSGQEAVHGKAHEAAFGLLERDGIEHRDWLRWYETLAWKRLEPVAPPLLRLSVTVALEHLTASLGEAAFVDRLLDHAHPAMRDLLLWHAAEELEHKSVAFDVYEAVGGGYLVRVLGMVIALLGLLFFWRSATKHLLRQDGGYRRRDMAAMRQKLLDAGYDRSALFLGALRDYLRPGFHPDQRDNLHHAQAFFAAHPELA
jgi:hypothetical protein